MGFGKEYKCLINLCRGYSKGPTKVTSDTDGLLYTRSCGVAVLCTCRMHTAIVSGVDGSGQTPELPKLALSSTLL